MPCTFMRQESCSSPKTPEECPQVGIILRSRSGGQVRPSEYTFRSEETAKAGNRRARKVGTVKKVKPVRRRKRCPCTGCSTVTRRLPQHLQTVHRLQKDQALYKRAIRAATVVPEGESGMRLPGESATMDQQVECLSTDSEMEQTWIRSPIARDGECSGKQCESEADPAEDADLASAAEIMVQFRDWLLSPDGGRKDAKTVKQHVSQLKHILSVVDPEGSLTSLVDSKLIRNVFLGEYATKYCPTTIKSYLMSLQHYCSFLLSDKPHGVDFDCEEITRLREKFKRWSTSYKSETTKRRWEKMEQDVDDLITPEKINSFEKSHAAREAIILLGQLCGAHNIELRRQGTPNEGLPYRSNHDRQR